MKLKVKKAKTAIKPTKKVGKEASGKVKTATKPVGIPRMRKGNAK
jgi:hypothetical protein